MYSLLTVTAVNYQCSPHIFFFMDRGIFFLDMQFDCVCVCVEGGKEYECCNGVKIYNRRQKSSSSVWVLQA